MWLEYNEKVGEIPNSPAHTAIQQVTKTRSNLMRVFALGHGLSFPSLGPGC
jgi:hypothetical protein